MQPFFFKSPTRILFGEDISATAFEVLSELGATNTLIVTDDNLLKAGVLSSIIRSFEQGKEPVIFDQVPMDSDVNCVGKAAYIARQTGCDAILAVGGGSVMDTAKGVNICLTYGGDVRSWQGLNNLESKLKPLVAVPTTAGTGSEVSFVAMIKSNEEGKKLLYGSTYLAPDAALLDPKLTVSLPPRLTAATGMDALTHAIECYVAMPTISPLTDALCLQAMHMLFGHLERATTNGADLEARSQTLVASCMAGLAFTNAGLGIVHAMAHSIGGRFGTHHGATNAVLLPHGMEFNLDEVSCRYASAARYLGMSKAPDNREAARDLISSVRNLISACRLPERLRDLGVPESDATELIELAELSSLDAAMMFNPKEPSIEDIVGIYERAY